MRRGQKGFTLIELLVVIAILGILAAVAIPRIIGAIDNGRRSANVTNAATLQAAVARFNVDNDSWPVVGGALPTTGTLRIVLDVGTTRFGTYLQGGQLPTIRLVRMRDQGGNADERNITSVTLPAQGWHLDVNGTVVIVHGTGNHVWNPTAGMTGTP